MSNLDVRFIFHTSNGFIKQRLNKSRSLNNHFTSKWIPLPRNIIIQKQYKHHSQYTTGLMVTISGDGAYFLNH